MQFCLTKALKTNHIFSCRFMMILLQIVENYQKLQMQIKSFFSCRNVDRHMEKLQNLQFSETLVAPPCMVSECERHGPGTTFFFLDFYELIYLFFQPGYSSWAVCPVHNFNEFWPSGHQVCDLIPTVNYFGMNQSTKIVIPFS